MEELSKSIRTQEDLSSLISLSPGERYGTACPVPPLGIPPVFMRRIAEDPAGAEGPLRRQFVPTELEERELPYESKDPLFEADYSPLPRLVHRYPNRALLITTGTCAVYCRYCFRRQLSAGTAPPLSDSELEAAAGYVREHPEIKEIIFSGGDPVTLSDDRLRKVLDTFSAIRRGPKSEKSWDCPLVFRVATRVPTALPLRITTPLVRMLRAHVPLWVIMQINHPEELGPEAEEGLRRLADGGVPVVSQTVLLRGVNDDPSLLTRLFHTLLTLSVKPYYLFQGDLASGTSHFRLPLPRAFEIVRSLRSLVSGLAMPLFAVDLPGGGGKKALHEDMKLEKEGDFFIFTGADGGKYRYPDESGN